MNSLSPLFREVFCVPTDAAQDYAAALLRTHYGAAAVCQERGAGDGFTYAAGAVPMLLVAHTDVTHRRPSPTLYHDATADVVWAPEGLGADDRAGVYAIALLLERGYRPHVLFTDGEEVGGLGARQAAWMEAPPVRYLVELDRQGATDAVSYSHIPARSERKYLRKHGFTLEEGSYTDICELMPAWGIGGVNLSIGYYRQHTTGEHLRLGELRRTVNAVAKMLDAPPPRTIPYRPEVQRRRTRADDLGLSLDWEPAPRRCIHCGDTCDDRVCGTCAAVLAALDDDRL